MKTTNLLFTILCGGSLAVACGGSSTSNNGNDAGAGGSSSGGSTSSGGSSSGSGSDAATGDGGIPGVTVSCQDSSSCKAGQVCCATATLGGPTLFMVTVACANACPAMSFQVCASSSECANAGDTCTPSPIGMGSICAPPRGDGGFVTRDGGGIDDSGSSSDGGGQTEAGSTDGAAE